MNDLGASSLKWRKSTRSATNGDCVEFAETRDAVLVRDSKDPHGPRLQFSHDSWSNFIAGIRAGELD